MISKTVLPLLLALVACAPFTFDDNLRLTTSLADWPTAQHLCAEEGSDKVASVDVVGCCIKYNRDKLRNIAIRWGMDAVKGIWLHEVCHIKQIHEGKFNNMHTFSHVDLKRLELEADEFVGCHMKQQRLNHDEFLEYLQDSYIPDSKHGTLEQRIAAVQAGYDRCKAR